ncbi:MAG: hypothetical protein SO401_09110 [Blautia sp.]|nr:hypothetical protein [Blautia sp.]
MRLYKQGKNSYVVYSGSSYDRLCCGSSGSAKSAGNKAGRVHLAGGLTSGGVKE